MRSYLTRVLEANRGEKAVSILEIVILSMSSAHDGVKKRSQEEKPMETINNVILFDWVTTVSYKLRQNRRITKSTCRHVHIYTSYIVTFKEIT